jgi:hypothetical protein
MSQEQARGLHSGCKRDHEWPRFRSMLVFTPASNLTGLLQWTLSQVPSMRPSFCWKVETDSSPWSYKALLHQSTLWIVSHFVARQAMSSALMCWAESPMDSEHFFLVPRVLQMKYGQVNKHVNLLGQFHPLPPLRGPRPPVIPFLILHLPRFRRQLDSKGTGLYQPSARHTPQWVRMQRE